VCNAVEKGIGQPCGLKFLIEEQRPVFRRVYLRVLACQKWVRYFLQERAKNLPVPRQEARFDRLRALRLFLLCRDGTRNGLFRSEQGTASREGGGQKHGHGLPSGIARAERPKERGFARGASGCFNR